jgi:biopolymer transport protein ExbD
MNFRTKYRPDPVGFQVVPMIDILFLLLCFFLASQVYSQWEQEIDVKLPTAQTGQIPQRLPGEIIINIMKDGSVIINKQVLDNDRLVALLAKVVKLFPGQPVLIRADNKTSYESVIKVLDLCRTVDIWNISFATTATEEKSSQ